MKKTILLLLLGCSPAVTVFSRAQDAPPPPPHEDHAPQGEAQERMNRETARFHEEMEQHMKGAMEKAAALEAEGKKDEANEVRSAAKKKLQSAIENHQREMQEKMRGMHQRQRAEKIERAERERAEKRERQRAERLGRGPGPGSPGRPEADERPDGPPRPELERKLHHVEQAIGHLREAGLPDPAENLERVAQRLRNAMHDQPGPPPGRGPHPDGPPHGDHAGAPGHDEIGELRREIEELKKTVGELCKMRDKGGKKEGGQEGSPESSEKHH
jgi:uncharacterized protein (DUF305 family)